MTKQRPLRLRQASAHFRLAAKFDRAGQHASAIHHRKVADRYVAEERRNRERRQAEIAARKSWKEGTVMTTCGIHGTPVVDKRCVDCDAGTIVYDVIHVGGSQPPVWTVIMWAGPECKGGDVHWLEERFAREAKRRYDAGTAVHGELTQIIEQPELCGFEWTDGWGEHVCRRIVNHTTDHGCECDATTTKTLTTKETQS